MKSLGYIRLEIVNIATHLFNKFIEKIICRLNENKMKKPKYHTVGTFQNPIERDHRNGDKIDTQTQIQERSKSWLGTGTSVNSDGAKQFNVLKPPILW